MTDTRLSLASGLGPMTCDVRCGLEATPCDMSSVNICIGANTSESLLLFLIDRESFDRYRLASRVCCVDRRPATGRARRGERNPIVALFFSLLDLSHVFFFSFLI